jgi:hypothetical protein
MSSIQQVLFGLSPTASSWAVAKIGLGSGNGVTSVTITTSITVSSGGIVVLLYGANGAPTAPASFTDSASNTYTQRNQGLNTNSGSCVTTYTSPTSASLVSGGTMAITGLLNSDYYAAAYSASLFTAFDVGTGKQNAFGTSFDSGTTGAITGSSDAAIAGVCGGVQTFTSSWAGATVLDTITFNTRCFVTIWKNVTSGAQTATWTGSASDTPAAAICVVK